MKIAIVYPDAYSIWIFHRHLVSALQSRGHEVFAISAPDEYVERLTSMGVKHLPVRMSRHMSVVKDIALLGDFFRVFRQHRFDLVHTFTIKPNTFGAIAARLSGTRRIICTLEGLGFMYADNPAPLLVLLRPVADFLYYLGARSSHRVWFVNPDDRELMVSRGIVPRRKAFLTISAGVNPDEYYPGVVSQAQVQDLRNELAIEEGAVVVSMVVARVIRSKGVIEFLDAARLLSRHAKIVTFLLVGPVEAASPEAISEDLLRKLADESGVRWLGYRRDIKTIYTLSDVVALPSYYREGVPNVLLEAMALGKPVVTTNSVGCREVVDEGRNGYLVPVRDAAALAKALDVLIGSSEKRRAFGFHSRKRVEAEFDKRVIVDRVIRELYDAPL